MWKIKWTMKALGFDFTFNKIIYCLYLKMFSHYYVKKEKTSLLIQNWINPQLRFLFIAHCVCVTWTTQPLFDEAHNQTAVYMVMPSGRDPSQSQPADRPAVCLVAAPFDNDEGVKEVTCSLQSRLISSVCWHPRPAGTQLRQRKKQGSKLVQYVRGSDWLWGKC